MLSIIFLSGLLVSVAGRPGAEPRESPPLEGTIPLDATSTAQRTKVPAGDQGWDWPKCVKMAPGWCTLYIETGDHSQYSNHRRVTLFDSVCNQLQVLETDPNNEKTIMKGKSDPEKFVEITMEKSFRPKGWIMYDATDTQLGEDTGMECNKAQASDGVECRKAFECSSKNKPKGRRAWKSKSPYLEDPIYRYKKQNVGMKGWGYTNPEPPAPPETPIVSG